MRQPRCGWEPPRERNRSCLRREGKSLPEPLSALQLEAGPWAPVLLPGHSILSLVPGLAGLAFPLQHGLGKSQGREGLSSGL